VLDTVLLPGTAFVELALAAGARLGCETLDELTLEAPLVLAEDDAVQLQVTASEPDESDRRQIAIYSRPDRAPGVDAAADPQWTRHASAVLASSEDADPALEQLREEAWPPEGSEPVDIE